MTIFQLRFHHYTTFAAWSHRVPTHSADLERRFAAVGSLPPVVAGMQHDDWGRHTPGVTLDHQQYGWRLPPEDQWAPVFHAIRSGTTYGFTPTSQPKVNTAIAGPPLFRPEEVATAVQEFDEWSLTMHKWEGPIAYLPRVITQQYLLKKDEYVLDENNKLVTKVKDRIITDLTKAGIKEAGAPSTTSYDTIETLISIAKPNHVLVKGDEPKAFTGKPVHWTDWDACVVKHPTKDEYWRHCFTVFGATWGPHVQMSVARATCHIRACGYGSTPVSGPGAPPRDGAWRWVVLMDDYATVAMNLAIGEYQYAQMSMLQRHLGPTFADRKKIVATVGEFAGVTLIQATPGARVNLPDVKIRKYIAKIKSVLSILDSVGTVTRGEFAQLAGYLNFAAKYSSLRYYFVEIIHVLWPRDLFGDIDGEDTQWTRSHICPSAQHRGAADRKHRGLLIDTAPAGFFKWDSSERLSVPADVITLLQQWARELVDRNQEGILIYLEFPHQGFWKGQIEDSDEELNALPHGHCITKAGFPFVDTDATMHRMGAAFGRERMIVEVQQKFPHIMHVEMIIALAAVVLFHHDIAGSRPRTGDNRSLGRCDNQSDVGAWQKGWSSNPEITLIIRHFAEIFRTLNINHALRYIKTTLNVTADDLTRHKLKAHTDTYRLAPLFWKAVVADFKVTAEGFADVDNARTGTFRSLLHPWSSVPVQWLRAHVWFLNPPFCAILLHARETLAAFRKQRFSFAFVLPRSPKLVSSGVYALVADVLKSTSASIARVWPTGTHLFETRRCNFELLQDYKTELTTAFTAAGPTRWPVELWTFALNVSFVADWRSDSRYSLPAPAAPPPAITLAYSPRVHSPSLATFDKASARPLHSLRPLDRDQGAPTSAPKRFRVSDFVQDGVLSCTVNFRHKRTISSCPDCKQSFCWKCIGLSAPPLTRQFVCYACGANRSLSAHTSRILPGGEATAQQALLEASVFRVKVRTEANRPHTLKNYAGCLNRMEVWSAARCKMEMLGPHMVSPSVEQLILWIEDRSIGHPLACLRDNPDGSKGVAISTIQADFVALHAWFKQAAAQNHEVYDYTHHPDVQAALRWANDHGPHPNNRKMCLPVPSFTKYVDYCMARGDRTHLLYAVAAICACLWFGLVRRTALRTLQYEHSPFSQHVQSQEDIGNNGFNVHFSLDSQGEPSCRLIVSNEKNQPLTVSTTRFIPERNLAGFPAVTTLHTALERLCLPKGDLLPGIVWSAFLDSVQQVTGHDRSALGTQSFRRGYSTLLRKFLPEWQIKEIGYWRSDAGVQVYDGTARETRLQAQKP